MLHTFGVQVNTVQFTVSTSPLLLGYSQKHAAAADAEEDELELEDDVDGDVRTCGLGIRTWHSGPLLKVNP